MLTLSRVPCKKDPYSLGSSKSALDLFSILGLPILFTSGTKSLIEVKDLPEKLAPPATIVALKKVENHPIEQHSTPCSDILT